MDTSSDLDLVTQFHDACVAYSLNQNRVSLAEALEVIAEECVKSLDARRTLGGNAETWSHLRQLWKSIVAAQVASEDEVLEMPSPCISLARLTRNLVAGDAVNQSRAFENEPDIRRLIHHFTSWSATQDPGSFIATRTLTQALSNIVTSNEVLTSKLWGMYMALSEDQYRRLLKSPDTRTILTVSVLILNCIHGNEDRTRMLCTSPIGARACVSLLNGMVKFHDAKDVSDGARAFDVGYEIFTRIVEAGLVPVLFNNLRMEDEIITPHQTTLLKLLDSYLQTLRSATSLAVPIAQGLTPREELGPMLSDSFLALSTYAQKAIQVALSPTATADASAITSPSSRASPASPDKKAVPGKVRESTSTWFEESSESSESEEVNKSPKSSEFQNVFGSDKSTTLPSPNLAKFDVSLPEVCEALVLITQCIVTLTLEIPSSAVGMKTFFNNAQAYDGQGLIENAIGLLRQLDMFLPRINFGKPVDKPLSNRDMAKPELDIPGFSYLKRDVVRMLGILCHDVRAVQDRVRECGGIPILMNLCVIDERNPYLREHAIFALHSLLKGNAANQAVLDAIRPAETWDDDGNLQK